MVKMLSLLVLTFCLGLSGQTSAAEQKRLELAYTIVTLSGTAEMMEDVMALFMDQYVRTITETGTTETRVVVRLFRRLFAEEMEAIRDDLRWELAKVYSQYFTETELAGLLNFMASPIGLRWLKMQPVLEAEGEVLGAAWAQTISERTLQRIKRLAE